MNDPQQCLACEQTQDQVPLITLVFQDRTFYICPRHLPVLIHNPQLLAGRLPGAEGMSPSDHHDD